MREIKFRAWHREQRTMLKKGDTYGTSDDLDCVVYFMQGQPVELMQYTGLKDKNGVEIYEGDWIHYKYMGEFEDEGEITWSEAGARFFIKPRNYPNEHGCSFDELFVQAIEVIGNIYEELP